MSNNQSPARQRMLTTYGDHPREWPSVPLIGMSRREYSEHSGIGRGRLRKLIAAGYLAAALHRDRSIKADVADAILRALPRVDFRRRKAGGDVEEEAVTGPSDGPPQ